MSHRPTVLLVASPEDSQRLHADLKSCGHLRVLTAHNCRNARQALEKHGEIAVILTAASPGDGNWCDLLRFVVNRGINVHVVVYTPRCSERLRSEVIWRGAYDVLVQPFETAELRRIVEGAIRASHFSPRARFADA